MPVVCKLFFRIFKPQTSTNWFFQNDIISCTPITEVLFCFCEWIMSFCFQNEFYFNFQMASKVRKILELYFFLDFFDVKQWFPIRRYVRNLKWYVRFKVLYNINHIYFNNTISGYASLNFYIWGYVSTKRLGTADVHHMNTWIDSGFCETLENIFWIMWDLNKQYIFLLGFTLLIISTQIIFTLHQSLLHTRFQFRLPVQ